MIRFNYIVTIHNGEDKLAQVLQGLRRVVRSSSAIYTVLDGCTDGSEAVVDEHVAVLNAPVVKLYAPNVHELRSINIGLRAANQDGTAYNIILQDDVVLQDPQFEEHVESLYRQIPNLGYVSFRLGAHLAPDVLTGSSATPYTSYIESRYGHGLASAEPLDPGWFAFRTVPIKSPVCLPSYLLRTIGGYDERLAPYGHDDPELAIRAIQSGFVNGVFALPFESPLDWGATRKKPDPNMENIVSRNMNYIRDWHRAEIAELVRSTPAITKMQVIPFSATELASVALRWERARAAYDQYRTRREGIRSRLVKRVRRLLHV
ncbi:MAG: glycosyltransferase [Gemmatimonadota bacterium]